MSAVSTLSIHQLQLNVHLGWPKEERLNKQTIWIDIHIQFKKTLSACYTDDLSDTLCYQTLLEGLKERIVCKEFRLIEHLAYTVYQDIKKQIAFEHILNITLSKKPSILNSIEKVSFSFGDSSLW